VSDGGDDGNLGIENGFCQEFSVEGRKVFEGAAATGDDDDIDLASAVEIHNARGDFRGGCFALNERWVEEDVQASVAAIDDVDEVANDGAGGRGDDADAVWKRGERLFLGGIEEATCLKALLELFEGDLEGTGTDGLKELGNELHLAALLVDGDLSAEQNVEAVGGLEAQEQRLFAEEDDGELGVAILEREVNMARGRGTEVGDFAFDPEVAILALNVDANLADEVANSPDAARGEQGRHFKGEAELAWFALLLRAGAHNC
jgi:hypothetical protein